MAFEVEKPGATNKPNDFMISAFSAAQSPSAETVATAGPTRRPVAAVSPAASYRFGHVLLDPFCRV
jgi:hypothetical protein